MKLTDDGLAEWRAHPVGEIVFESLATYLNDQIDQCKESAWQGEPWPEARRQALQRGVDLLGHLREATAKDIIAWHAAQWALWLRDHPEDEIMEIHEDE
jgi:alpha-ketoglutarate-dependent taurine dioxygenase